ncbi:MAG: 3-deoxy-D-manno-octulosonic acid kinase [Xanthomonadales bacterium]|nr:3-deoxy-D-manno-octulosonic acid kinase [Xanthomonadales bacterium]
MTNDLQTQQLDPQTWLIYPAALRQQVQGCWFDREYWGEAAQPLAAERGGRRPPLLLPTDPGPSVWRHYQRGGAVARLLGDRYWWTGLAQSRPWLELQVTVHLHQAGLLVPRPLAARVQREGRWYRGDLLTEQIADCQTLAQCCADSTAALDWGAIGHAIGQLHRAGADHADLNAHNLLIDGDGRVWVLDFDRARLRPGAGRWQQANLERLRRSLIKLQQMPEADDWQRLVEAHAAVVAPGQPPGSASTG